VSAAFDSVMRITFEVRAGMVMRQIHHWAALVFVGAIVFHMLRVFFTGAFRKPREINWLLGFSLFLLGIFAGFTGYSLPDDLLSGTGLRIGYSIVLSIPVIGTWAAFLFFGGEFPSEELMHRLLVLHIMILPALLAAVMAAHVGLVWRQKHTQFRAPGRTEDTVEGTSLWPNYGMKALGLMFCVFAVLGALGGLAQINPIWLHGPFVPYSASSPAQPDWYMGWLEGIARLAPDWAFTVFGRVVSELFLPAVVFPGLFFTVVALWPFIEARATGDREVHHFLQRPREAPLRSAIGAAGLTLVTILTFAGANDVLARLFGVDVDRLNTWLRVSVLLLPAVVGYAVYLACIELRDADMNPVRRPRRLSVRWSDRGGFEEVGDDEEDLERTRGPEP
jgi:ubiquinol-cytochrome c reductase cytochrome b subunit